MKLAPGRPPVAGSTTAATLGIWQEVAERLAPMIGRRGVDALIGRSLHLISPAFPWLSRAGASSSAPGPLANFLARLEAGEPAEATEASLALLLTFTDLLATLIGASLAGRLLDPIWTLPAPSSSEEPAP